MPQITAGLKKGSAGSNVGDLQAYLKRFGYLDSGEAALKFGMRSSGAADATPMISEAAVIAAKASEFDEVTETALRRFQRFNRLPETGQVDDAVAALIGRPRCGVPDLAGFSASGRKWATNNLRYAFQNFTADLSNAAIVTAIEQAFALWAAETPLRFSQAPLASAEIVIRFVTGDHGDGSAFDGPNGVLAHAFFPSTPPAPPAPIQGDTHFDDAETWTVTVPPAAGAFDLVTVAAHEFGHALGLDHSSVAGSLMEPFYGGPHRFLHSDDVAGVTSLYGGYPIEHAAWAHGTDIQIEVPGNVESVTRFGFFTRLVGKPGTTNWYHLPVTTPVIIKGNRLAIARAMLRFSTGGPAALVRDVHIFDGETRIAAHNGINLSGSNLFTKFGVAHKPDVFWGMGITMGITTAAGTAAQRTIDIISGGIDFLA